MGLSAAAKKTETSSLAKGNTGGERDESVNVRWPRRQAIHVSWYGRIEQQLEKTVVLKKAEKEVIRRVSVILDTPLSYQSKINAINIFASVLALTFLWFIFLTKILMRLNLSLAKGGGASF